jgi:hypothetical protein
MYQYNTIGNLTNYAPEWLWIAGLIVLLWSIWKRKRDVIILSGWYLFLFLAANPALFNLPGTGTIGNFAIFIAAYIPLGLLCGVLAAETHQLLPAQWRDLAMIGVIIVAGTLGARQRIREISPQEFSLVTRPDLQASEWIQETITRNSRFLVNSFFAYGNTLVVGSDGGWWLPLLAERKTSLPPLTYSWETGPSSDNIEWVNNLTYEFQDKGLLDDDFLAMLEDRHITHIYIGQRGGRVNYPGPYTLSPDQISTDPNFQMIYHKDHVWIFSIE